MFHVKRNRGMTMYARDVAVASVIVAVLLVIGGVIGGVGLLALDIRRCNQVEAETGLTTTYTLFDRCTVEIFGFRVPV